MKRLISILMAVILLLGLSACGNSKELSESGNAAGQETSKTPEVATPQDTTTPMENTENTGSDHSPNILVAYFSRTGTTESLAKYAAEYLNADIFEIEAAVPYSDEDIAY